MRSVVIFIIAIVGGLAAGCAGPRGVEGKPGSTCTVVNGDAGAKVISCSDGTSVVVPPGEPGTSCTVTAAGDGGARTVSCEDGTQVTITDGQPGTSCTISAAGDGGVKTITCADGTHVTITDGAPGTPPIPTVLGRTEDLPGLVIQVVSLSGGTGPNGNFQIGDTIAATFTVRTNAGVEIPLASLDSASIWVAGPTFGYQRVLPSGRDKNSLGDVKTVATRNADGSYTYRFASPLPGVYGPPLWDTTKFADGELTGQPLQHGTYTLALRFFRNYTIDGVTVRDVGDATRDFLLGTATAIAPREIVSLGNCNQCHVELQAHGGTYRDTKLCVTCHTAGAEDRNSTDTGDATPVTIDFRVMIHKMHDGAHLPSVLGVGVNADGTRNYAATPVPYAVGGSPVNFSNLRFPVWPNLDFPMPRPRGFSALPAAQQVVSDEVRRGTTACEKCHGDPDGAGPLAAPAQGDFAFTRESRLVCGSCHDDIDWTKPYKKNFDTGMPSQPNDANCAVCHPDSTEAVGGAPRFAHRHPLNDPAFNPGLVLAITGVAEAGAANGDGTVDPGEKVAVTFTMKDAAGADAPASAVPSLSVVVAGPTTNRNMLLSYSIPAAALAGSQPWTVNLPEPVILEAVGTSTAATGDVLSTARAPHWNLTGAATTVYVRAATGGASTLAAAARASQNFVDVQSSAPFLRNDYIVVEDGVAGREEYLRIQWVDGNRLWFASAGTTAYQPALRIAHAAGATVTKVTLTTKTAVTDYTLAAATGAITEVTEFGAGAVVLASYTADFVMPAIYGPAMNESPDLGAAAGKWAGLPLVSGTYTVGLWGSRNLTLTANGETNTYRGTSKTATADFRVGSATTITPRAVISSGANCERCHNDVMFHGGGRRGVDGCLLCHGASGTEDRPRYVAPNAPATTGLSIEFRSMLHKVHMGEDLANGDTYQVVGFGSGAYPNNFGVVGFGEVTFPSQPGGAKNCAACHGTSTAWQAPADRTHPTAAPASSRSWQVACGSCHDTTAAAAHFEVMTSAIGAESCAVCHDTGRDLSVALAHKIR